MLQSFSWVTKGLYPLSDKFFPGHDLGSRFIPECLFHLDQLLSKVGKTSLSRIFVHDSNIRYDIDAFR